MWTVQWSDDRMYSVCFVMCRVCVQSVRGMLENPTEAVNDLSYFDCIDSVMENSKVDQTSLLLCLLFLPIICFSSRFSLITFLSLFDLSLLCHWCCDIQVKLL